MLHNYKRRFIYRNCLLTNTEKLQNHSIYKRLIYMRRSFVILKLKTKTNRLAYICKEWNGDNWESITSQNNPRDVINFIKSRYTDSTI